MTIESTVRVHRTLLSACLTWVGVASLGCTSQPRILLGEQGQAVGVIVPEHPASQIAVDAEHLYWLSWDVAAQPGWQGDGDLVAVATQADKDGGNPTTIARLGADFHQLYYNFGLIIGASDVVVTSEFDVGLAVRNGNPTATRLYTGEVGTSGPGGVVADDTDVFFTVWSYDAPGAVMRVAKTGGAPMTLAPAQHRPSQITIDATHIYWIVASPDASSGELMSMPRAGGQPTALARVGRQDCCFPGHNILADENDVYFSEDLGALRKVAKTGGQSTVVAAGNFTSEPVADAGNIYMIDDYNSVLKISKSDYSVTTLFENLDPDKNVLRLLAVDDATVYWTSDDGTIRYLSK